MLADTKKFTNHMMYKFFFLFVIKTTFFIYFVFLNNYKGK
ncbi:hypothetical protein BAME_23700 [Bacillus sp. M 2-6]|nr:hypothetical protein BAME_23700 [Bacillus sp. M 2-6]